MTTRVTISAIAAGGDGVGRLDDGLTVFVPRTAPGDDVEIRLAERKRRWARGHLVRVVRPGAGRVEPPCPHYVADACGGCQLQHLAPDVQLASKQRIVGDALRRIGRIETPDPPITASPRAWRYRSKITLSVSPARDRVGLRRYDRPETIFPLHDCHIAGTALMRRWARLRDAGGLLPPGAARVVLREDRDGSMHVVVRGGTPPWDPGPLVERLGASGVSVWWAPTGGGARVVAGGRTGYPALAFAQINAEFAAAVQRDAVRALDPGAGWTVWDLYGGVGDTARLLAAAGAHVHAVELDRGAVAWARRQERPPGAPDGSPRYIQGRVEEVLHRLPEPDAVLVNPPRAGLARPVTRRLQDWAASGGGEHRLVYVSCDPATLARDIHRMPALRVRACRAYDLFPQTAHVETMAVLTSA